MIEIQYTAMSQDCHTLWQQRFQKILTMTEAQHVSLTAMPNAAKIRVTYYSLKWCVYQPKRYLYHEKGIQQYSDTLHKRIHKRMGFYEIFIPQTVICSVEWSEVWALNTFAAETLAVDQRKIARILLSITLRDRKSKTLIRQQIGVKDITETLKKDKHR